MEVADVLGYRRPRVENDLKHLIDVVKAEVDDREDVEPRSREPFFGDKATLPQSRHIVVKMVNNDVVCFRGDSWLLRTLRGCSEAGCLLTMSLVSTSEVRAQNC
jgi:hypothetical protein